MEPTTTHDPALEDAPASVNWYSGWRLLVTATVTVIGAKLVGIVGLLFAVPLFLWLQPKRGAWVALAVAVCTGLAAAVLYSAFVMPAINAGRSESSAPASEVEWWKRGATPHNSQESSPDWERGTFTPPPK